MSAIRDILDTFGIRATPWVIRIYIVLLLICVGLLVFALNEIPPTEAQDHPATRLFDFAMDSFKIVLGAVIGSLSMAAQRRWGGPQGTVPDSSE
jgi:hypothetical protein